MVLKLYFVCYGKFRGNQGISCFLARGEATVYVMSKNYMKKMSILKFNIMEKLNI